MNRVKILETCDGCGEQREIRIILDDDRLCEDCRMRWLREEEAAAAQAAEQSE